MNKITIAVLIIILLILLFIMYLYFTTPSNLTNTVSLKNTQSSTTTISSQKLQNRGNSSNWTISTWVYLNSTLEMSSTKMNTIISRGTIVANTTMIPGTIYDFVLFFSLGNIAIPVVSSAAPSANKGVCLYCTFKSSTAGETTDKNIVKITNDFPIQQWTQITVVIKNKNMIDYYLNGKLVFSFYASNIPTTTISSDINIGANSTSNKYKYFNHASTELTEAITDAYLAKLNYFSTVLTPQQVYDNYLKGAGTGILLPNYNLKLSLLNNNIEQKYYSLY
jgi:hypothetical protein